MEIIDSHVHFWNPAALRYEWLDEMGALNAPLLPADYRGDTAGIGVSGIVFVQADCLPEQGLDEARWISTLDPLVAGIVAFAPLEQGAKARTYLEEVAAIPKVKGVRRLIQSEGLGFATQPAFIEGVRLLADYDLTFDLCIRHWQLEDVIALVRACPGVRFVLDHIGKPNIAAGEIEPWAANLRELASIDGVMCKVSGMVTEADPAWTAAHLLPYLDVVRAAFGVERLMFGSDWPVCRSAATYRQWWDILQADFRLSDAEQKLFYSENAKAFYHL